MSNGLSVGTDLGIEYRKWKKESQFDSDISITNHPIPVLHLSVSCLRKWGSGAILQLLSGNLWSLIHSYLGAGINAMEWRKQLIHVHCIVCYLFLKLYLNFLSSFFSSFEEVGMAENWSFRTGPPWQENKWKKLLYLHVLEQQLPFIFHGYWTLHYMKQTCHHACYSSSIGSGKSQARWR